MMYPVTVPCRNIVESMERTEWANERGINILFRTWEIVVDRQHLTFHFTFHFENEKDALIFALVWL
jgi:hypothetical protein